MSYPYIVDIAWDTVECLISDWQDNPFIFETELDIQVELAARLNSTYRALGLGFVKGEYPENNKYGLEQKWNRVTCGPSINYKWKILNDAYCKPDVVVWEDLSDPTNPPGDDDNWPMLWVCEIKYEDKEPRFHKGKANDPNVWDIDKLNRLINSSDAKFGCSLHLIFMQKSPALEIEKKEKVWLYKAYIK